MRILWLHQYFATPRGWGAVRTYEFARRFCSQGHSVDVVCCAGYDESLKVAQGAPVAVDGIHVYVSGTGYKPHMGFVRRVVSYLQFMAHALWHVLRKGGEYDVVIASSGPLTLAVPALAGRWLRHVPFVFEVIDVWPDSAIAAGVLKNPLLKWLSFRLEALAYANASAIVTCSTGMTERVAKKLGVRAEDGGQRAEGGVVTISNSCDLQHYTLNGDVRWRTREKLGVRDDQLVVLYTGAMGRSNAVEDLVEAVRGTAEDKRIIWWFAGGGPEEKRLRADVGGQRAEDEEDSGQDSKNRRVRVAGRAEWQRNETMNPDNPQSRPSTDQPPRFFGSLPKMTLIDLYLAADVNVVTFMHEPLFDENSPNKFFDGIAAGLPAVFNRSTWLEPWLVRYDCGIACKSEKAGAEMARELKALAGDGGRRRRMGLGARRLAEDVFSRDKLAVRYLELLNGVVLGSSAATR